MSDTKIEWAEKSWNPISGCSPVSEGCQNCYAERMAKRLAGRFGYPKDDPFRVTLHAERLNDPLKWKKPTKIFVCSMGDLFHPLVKDEWIRFIWWGMVHTKLHQFLILTKRPIRMKEFLEKFYGQFFERIEFMTPDNIWLGVSVENQKRADERIPILLQIPAKVRFVSVEPMLGPVDLARIKLSQHTTFDCLATYAYSNPNHVPYQGNRLDWVILGGETGPGARPMHPDWARSVRDQCQEAGVPFFFKNMGSAHEPELAGKITAGRLLDGRFWEELPDDLGRNTEEGQKKPWSGKQFKSLPWP